MSTTSGAPIPLALALVAALAPAVARSDPAPDSVEVFGAGQTRQVQNITRKDLTQALPGTSPLKTLQKLPGVSFQSADAFGAYEWSTRISVRGFSQGQMGFTLDGLPLGNMAYGNSNGLHISRAIIPENIRQVNLAQGSGSVGTASTSNLGATVQFVSADPADSSGVSASHTVGSNSMRRTFVRLDSGVSATLARAMVSAVRQHALKWKGQGPQDLTQFNGKLVQGSGRHRLSVFYNYAARSESDYQDMSLRMRDRLGWDWDNYAPDWDRALLAARGVFSGAVASRDDAYYGARGLRRDHLAGAALELENEDASVRLKASAYYHRNLGQGHWYTPYLASSRTVPVAIRTTEYGVNRHGVLADLSWKGGVHTVNGGLWVERNTHDLVRNYYAVSGPAGTNRFLRDPMLTAYRQQFFVRTAQFHLQDTVTMRDDRLTLNAGFKHPGVRVEASSINAVRAAGTLEASEGLLPQLGLRYDLSRHVELFASAARNRRAFEAGVLGQFAQSQQAFDAGSARLRPETSTNADAGVRYSGGTLSASVALYQADFRDRLLSVATCAGVMGCPNTVVNVGRVSTKGLESAASWAFARHWNWFNSLTLNRSRYGADYRDHGVLVAVAGKQVVDAPATLLHTELGYDDKRWFARLGGKYTARRYTTFTNDSLVPSYMLWDLGAGVHHGALTLRVNVNNLFGKRYFSTIGSNQFVASDRSGNFATMLAGAPRELFFSVSGQLK